MALNIKKKSYFHSLDRFFCTCLNCTVDSKIGIVMLTKSDRRILLIYYFKTSKYWYMQHVVFLIVHHADFLYIITWHVTWHTTWQTCWQNQTCMFYLLLSPPFHDLLEFSSNKNLSITSFDVLHFDHYQQSAWFIY